VNRHRGAGVLRSHGRSGGAQHALGVVAGRAPLDHGGRPVGEQPGQQQAGLHLRARHRQPVLDPAQLGAPHPQRGEPIVARRDLGAHQAQRLDHPVDRPAADRFVAVQRPLAARLPRQPSRQQPQQRPRVADVDRLARRERSAKPDTANPQPVLVREHLGAEILHRREGRARVLGSEVVADDGLALPDRRDQRRAVGDRLVGRRGERAAQRSGGVEAGHVPPATTETT
jgi:hypothetical protein